MKSESVLIDILQDAMETRNFQVAINCIEQLDEIGVLDDKFLYIGAFVHFQEKRYQKTINYAKRTIIRENTRFDAEAYALLGRAERELLHFEKAAEALKQSNAIVQTETMKKSNFVTQNCLLLGQMQLQMGHIEKAQQFYLEAVQYAEHKQEQRQAYSSYLMTLHYRTNLSEDEVFQKHLKYQQFFEPIKNQASLSTHKRKKIRVGYISPDFRAHVMYAFYQPFLCDYDKSQFEVYVYALNEEDRYSKRLQKHVACWRNLKDFSEEEMDKTIRADVLDILFDLAGHSANSGLPLFKLRLAPVQISGLGYFDTTGLKEMDYFLTDVYTDPPHGQKTFFSEKLLRLPNCQFCYTPPDSFPKLQEPPYKRRGYVTFCCFNKYAKISDEVLEVWSEILNQLPEAKLILKSFIYADKKMRLAAVRRMAGFKISSDRLDIRPATNTYMEEFQEADIALDTFPYPGGGTTCDALFMGIPVITMEGIRHGERFGYSILCNAGLKELTAKTKAEYVAKAVALANDGDLLNLLHKNLRAVMQTSPLMDKRHYMMEVETFYRKIIRERQGNENGEKQQKITT